MKKITLLLREEDVRHNTNFGRNPKCEASLVGTAIGAWPRPIS